MKKLFPLIVATAGIAAYLVLKNKKEAEENEVKMISLDLEEDDTTPIFDETSNEPEVKKEADVENQEDEPIELIEELEEALPDESEILLLQYPFLKQSFIQEVLGYAESFNDEYPLDSSVRINHVVKFARAEEMIEFVKLIQNDNYELQEAAEENTLLIIRDCQITEGLLLEEVLRIANLINKLGGEYFGFRIDKL